MEEIVDKFEVLGKLNYDAYNLGADNITSFEDLEHDERAKWISAGVFMYNLEMEEIK